MGRSRFESRIGRGSRLSRLEEAVKIRDPSQEIAISNGSKPRFLISEQSGRRTAQREDRSTNVAPICGRHDISEAGYQTTLKSPRAAIIIALEAVVHRFQKMVHGPGWLPVL